MRSAPPLNNVPRIDFRDFASLLRQCTSFKSLKKLHEQISVTGYDRYTFLGNHLIHMYGKCGCIQEARSVFDRIKHRNVFSWNIMLAAFAHNGDLQAATDLFHKMPRRDLFTWNSVIAANTQNGDLAAADDLFRRMNEKDVVSWNTVIAAHANQGQMVEARSLFDAMPDRSSASWNSMITGYSRNEEISTSRYFFDKIPQHNLLSWNLMIAGYVENGLGSEAIGLLAVLDCEGIQPDIFTFTSGLDACSVIADLSLGRELHWEMETMKLPLEWNVIASTALVTMYGKCGDVGRAKSIFDSMEARNLISWNAMITAFGENGKLDHAEEVFEQLPSKDLASWNVLLSGYAQHGHTAGARRVFASIPEKDVVSWNAMISAYSADARLLGTELEGYSQVVHTAEDAVEAFKLFRGMDMEGVQPNKITFMTILSTCNGNPSLPHGRLVHKLVADCRLDTEVSVGTSLVIMYGKCGSPAESKAVFDAMEESRSKGTWNSLVAAYARNGQTLQAIELLRELNLEGAVPHFLLFNSVLFGCSHGGLVQHGLQLFQTMREFGVAPNFSHFLCMIDLLARAGELEAAERLIHSMPFEADSFAWTSFLSACKSHNDVERGASAARRLLDSDSQQTSSYVLMSNMLGAMS